MPHRKSPICIEIKKTRCLKSSFFVDRISLLYEVIVLRKPLYTRVYFTLFFNKQKIHLSDIHIIVRLISTARASGILGIKKAHV
jgi:hypothetical protein